MTEQMRVEPEFPVPDDKPTDPEAPRYSIEVFYEYGGGDKDTFLTSRTMQEDKESVWWHDTHILDRGRYQRKPSTRVYSKRFLVKYTERARTEEVPWD